jgi:hypothetical protein
MRKNILKKITSVIMVGVIIFSTVVFSKAAFYESESNNTWGTANSIPINSEITGNLQTYSDVDYYKFTVAVPSGIQLVFNHDVPADYASWDVELYNANAEEITSFNSSQYNVTKTSSYIRVPAGTYYIEVSNSTWDDIDYNLTVSAKDESASNFEKEVNNTWGTAQTISINKEYTCNLQTYDDVDYYKFTVTASTSIQLEFRHEVPTDYAGWDVELFYANGNELTSAFSSQYDVDVLSSNTELSTGVYYIMVDNTTWSDIDYKLTVLSPIDKTPPVITVGAYTTTPTNQNVTVTVSTNEGTLNATSHTFTANGSFDFIATDAAGNVTTRTVTISNIDKTPPIITVGSYTTTPTNQNVTVSVSTNEGTLNAASHTFTSNGSFDFIATDAAGNVTTRTVTISNIDKTAPVITVGSYTTTPTNQNVTVSVSTNEGMLNTTSHTFTANGNFDFIATDAAGNVTTRTVTISNIDKTPPIITVGSYTTTPTNQDVVVTASTNEGTLNTTSHIFTANGSFDFIATDAAGNVTTRTVTISNIDKTAPIITVGSYTTAPTNQNVVVTASTNKGTLNTTSHTFTANGSFDFIATDAAGNVTTRTVTISNIDKTPPVITVGSYTTAPTNQDVVVTASTNEGTLNTTSHTFTANGSFDFIATDAVGNLTTRTVIISNIDKTAPVITVGNYTTTPTNQNVAVSVSTNEGTLNAASHTFTSNGSFDFIATDAAGNLTTRTVAISNIDKTAPATPTLSPSTTVTTNSNVFVTITYPADADVKEYMLSAGVWTPYTEEVNISANNTVFARCKDTAGNYSSINSISISNIDKAAPVVVGVSNNETYIAGRTITFNEGTAILDGNPIVNGSEVSSIGMHILIVTDTVGNSTTIIFTIIDPVTKISLNVTNLKWAVGRTGTFIVTILPSNATNKAVSWKSSNTAVTTVDNAGILTAKGVGKATLTCTAKDGSGIKATCTITVVPKTPTNLKAVKASTTSIKLTWSPVSGVTGYYLFRSTSKTGTYSYIKTITATSYINTGLTKGKTYYYKVQAFKMVGSTPYRSASTAISSATL